MSLTDKLFMLPNEQVAMALGLNKDDLHMKEKVTFRNDLVWAIKTAKKELIY